MSGSASYVENRDMPAPEFGLPVFHCVGPAGMSIAEYFVKGKRQAKYRTATTDFQFD